MVTFKYPISAKMSTIQTFGKQSQPETEEDYQDNKFYTNKDESMYEFHVPELPVLIQ